MNSHTLHTVTHAKMVIYKWLLSFARHVPMSPITVSSVSHAIQLL